ncbi:hypothetical protein K9N68_32665 [Kovacikia minuta CCNUW1]|uniref:hypothetical protein n=1 Tax=Kovacikia minuta TaxID=2931930 RepID=UPI001CCADAD1|nr:hypothetical protein [Kovacikia minuta]UBF26211.1 hypothetical protein K9N68_32665 [Kovacikia minuta CCNUW1]
MPLKTRGSAALDKAQRRLANLKSIDENLDLGYGLTIQTYAQLIEATRIALDTHNTIVSNLHESVKTVADTEKALSEMSERMLMGVATRFGRSSKQYSKAGGSSRKGKTTTSHPDAAMTDSATLQNGSNNGNVQQPVLN